MVLIIWIPGRALIRLLRQLGSAPGATWSAVAASLVFMPVPLSWLWRFSNDRFIVLAAVLTIDAILIIFASSAGPSIQSSRMFPTKNTHRLFTALVAWVAACVFGSFWIPQAGERLATTAAYDYIKHHAVMLSLERYPLPLHNIFYAAQADTPYYYYEYFYLVPASLRTLSGNRISIAAAFGFTSALLASVFIALVFLIARDLLNSAHGGLLAAACVSIVGGWDIFGILVRVALGQHMVVTMDSWCPVAWRIHNLMTQFYWCPQHVLAVTTLLLVCRWLRYAPWARWWIAIAPLAAASIFGSSVYLALTIFPAAAVYMIMRLRRTNPARIPQKHFLAAIGGIVLLGTLLMADQAWHYHSMNQRYTGGLTWHWERFPLAVLGRILPPGPFANLLDAPWVILLEFGLPAVAFLLVSRRLLSAFWNDPGMRLLMIAGVLGTVTMFIVHSDINPIDYGFRVSIMPAMVVAAVCVGALLDAQKLRSLARPWRKVILVVGLLPGLSVGLYEAPLAATRSLIEKPLTCKDSGAIHFLRESTPLDAVVQGDPIGRLLLPQLIDRNMGVLDPDNPHVVVFRPLDMARMHFAAADIQAAFSEKSSFSAHQKLRKWGITYVLAGIVEQRRYGPLEQFRDPILFETVYDDGQAAVYRVLDVHNRISGERQPACSNPITESP